MFRRKWSGLPEDPVFPSDLKSLGYFINDVDEIRSIDNPKHYFKFFLSKNERVNDRQRFHFDGAVEEIIASRLENEGLQRIQLPLDPAQNTDIAPANNPPRPHVPIYITPDLPIARRIVVIVGESAQDLGVVAHRVIGRPGGINAGSMVSVVRALRSSQSPPPAVVLANPGQLWWWPAGGRALSRARFLAAPMRSAVHWGRYYVAGENGVPRNRTPAEHVRCVFEEVVRGLGCGDATVDVVGVGDGADEVEAFLADEKTWKVWGPRMGCLALLGGFYRSSDVKCAAFKQFLRERARAWCAHQYPLGTLISGPDGNPRTHTFTQAGCPVFSGATAQHIELLLITARPAVLAWLQEVARVGPSYKNPEFECMFGDLPEQTLEWKENWETEKTEGEEVTVTREAGENGGRVLSDDDDNSDDEKDKKMASDAGSVSVRVQDLSLKG